MIIHKQGDLFTSDADIIGHGTNCIGIMGSGIALQFKQRYPLMHSQYKNLCKYIPVNELVGSGIVCLMEDKPIANIFSQDLPGKHAKYEWAISGIKQVEQFMLQNNMRNLALPQIGCGIGGLKWPIMQAHLNAYFEDSYINLELWSL